MALRHVPHERARLMAFRQRHLLPAPLQAELASNLFHDLLSWPQQVAAHFDYFV